MDPVPTEELGALAAQVRESAGADRAAVEALCRALWPRLHLVLARTERDADVAADLAQDAVLEVVDALATGRVEQPDRIASFAVRVARSRAASAGRTRVRRDGLLAAAAEAMANEAPTFDHVDLPRLGRCVDGLPFRDRQALFETFFLERPIEAIAETLATTAGNVRVIRHRALEALRRCLGLQDPA